MTRPRIICHMISSLDGRLHALRWGETAARLMEIYEAVEARIPSDGWICGRVTMEDMLPMGAPAIDPARRGPREDRIADAAGRRLAVCVDREGRARPESGDLDGDHLVLALSERVSDAHAEAMAARGVSVVFTGPGGEDLAGALARIGAAFGVDALLLEGGGTINAAFLRAGLIDETSTILFPAIDGEAGQPAIYDGAAPAAPRRLALIGAEPLECGSVWLRHRVVRD